MHDNISIRSQAHVGPAAPPPASAASAPSAVITEEELRRDPLLRGFLDGLRVDQRPSGLRVLQECVAAGIEKGRVRLLASQPPASAALSEADVKRIEQETVELVRRANATLFGGVPYSLGPAPVRPPTEDPALKAKAAAIVASLPQGA